MIFVICLTEKGAMSQHSKGWRHNLKLNITDPYFFISRNELSLFRFSLNVIIKIAKLRPKLVVAINGEYNPFLSIILLAARFLRCYSLITWHDVTPHLGSIANRFYWLFALFNSRISNAVLVHNSNYKTLYGLNNKSIFSPLPSLVFDSLNLCNSSKQKSNAIVFLGRVEYYKGIERILSLYTGSKDTHLRNLVVIGSLSEQYKKLFENKLHKKITYYNYLDDNQLMQLLLASEAIIMPYRHCSQSLNPYWASLTSNALIISNEVASSLDFLDRRGVYQFSSHDELELLISENSTLLPYCGSTIKFDIGYIISEALSICKKV